MAVGLCLNIFLGEGSPLLIADQPCVFVVGIFICRINFSLVNIVNPAFICGKLLLRQKIPEIQKHAIACIIIINNGIKDNGV